MGQKGQKGAYLPILFWPEIMKNIPAGMSYEVIIRKNYLIQNPGRFCPLQKFKVANSDIHHKLYRTHPYSDSWKWVIDVKSGFWYRAIFDDFCMINQT